MSWHNKGKPAHNRTDLTGKRFGRLEVLYPHDTNGKLLLWRCRCDCGTETSVLSTNLIHSHTKSCGCLSSEISGLRMKSLMTVHGMTGTPTHISWKAMIQRCRDPHDSKYHLYGGAGIKVCERWKKFENFLDDMGKRPIGKTLGRIEGSGNYEPSNCAWQTIFEQNNNRKPWRWKLTRKNFHRKTKDCVRKCDSNDYIPGGKP